MTIDNPTQLVEHFAFILAAKPGHHSSSSFAEAFAALESFKEKCRTEEGREALQQCIQNLEVAYELFEDDDDFEGRDFVQETLEMFQKAQRYIVIGEK